MFFPHFAYVSEVVFMHVFRSIFLCFFWHQPAKKIASAALMVRARFHTTYSSSRRLVNLQQQALPHSRRPSGPICEGRHKEWSAYGPSCFSTHLPVA